MTLRPDKETLEQIKLNFQFDPIAGTLHRLDRRKGRQPDWPLRKKRTVQFNHKKYTTGHIAFFRTFGYWPNIVFYSNRKATDIRLANLCISRKQQYEKVVEEAA
jgi:hypothetical protein